LYYPPLPPVSTQQSQPVSIPSVPSSFYPTTFSAYPSTTDPSTSSVAPSSFMYPPMMYPGYDATTMMPTMTDPSAYLQQYPQMQSYPSQ
jgi:hypothetical protein